MIRWLLQTCMLIVVMTGLAWLGLIAGRTLVASDGDAAATLLLAHSSSRSVGVLALSVVASTVLAGAICLLRGWLTALFGMGVALTALASETGTFEQFLSQQGSLVTLSIETVGWALTIFIISTVCISLDRRADSARLWRSASATVSPAGIGFRACVASAILLPVVFLLARDASKGQTIAATSIGSLMVGLIGSFLLPRRTAALALVGVPLAGMVGYAFCAWQHGSIAMPQIGSSWTPLALSMPQDYAAGALVGGTAGIGLGRSLLHSDAQGADAGTTGQDESGAQSSPQPQESRPNGTSIG